MVSARSSFLRRSRTPRCFNVSYQAVHTLIPFAQLLRIRSPAGTSRLTVEPSTSGEEFAQMMLAALPKDDVPPDPSTLRLSNQPGNSGETVPFDALVGRKVGDMGFRYVTSSIFSPA